MWYSGFCGWQLLPCDEGSSQHWPGAVAGLVVFMQTGIVLQPFFGILLERLQGNFIRYFDNNLKGWRGRRRGELRDAEPEAQLESVKPYRRQAAQWSAVVISASQPQSTSYSTSGEPPPRMIPPLGSSTAAVSVTPLAISPLVASSDADQSLGSLVGNQSSGWLPRPMLASGVQDTSRYSLPSSDAPYIARATPPTDSIQQVPYAESTGSLSVESNLVSNQTWQNQTNAGLAFQNHSYPMYMAPFH